MGRPRTFCEHQALEKAMEVFWTQGYEAASLSDLLQAMGISRSSFYETFGSKHDLYLATIRHYDETMIAGDGSVLDGDFSVREALRSKLTSMMGNCADEAGRRGCFIANSAVEMSAHDEEARERVAAALGHLEEKFRLLIERGQARGEVAVDKDSRILARYIVTAVNGLQVAGKVRGDCDSLKKVVDVVLTALD